MSVVPNPTSQDYKEKTSIDCYYPLEDSVKNTQNQLIRLFSANSQLKIALLEMQNELNHRGRLPSRINNDMPDNGRVLPRDYQADADEIMLAYGRVAPGGNAV